MKVTALLLTTLAVTEAFNLPNAAKKITTEFAKGCATVATCATLLTSPISAQAADETAFKVDINTPYLVELVKTGDARQQTIQRSQFLFDSVKNFLGPAVNVELPTDIQGVAKKAFSGGATVSVNGQDVGVKVVGSEQGYLTIQVSNKLIPAIPFAGLDSTPWLVNAAADAASKTAPAVVETAVRVMDAASSNQEPFWDTPINDGNVRVDVGSIHKAITPKDIVGVGSLGLGAAYGASYAYWKYERQTEEETAAAKKKAAAEKRAAAAKKKKATEAAAKAEPVVANGATPEEEVANEAPAEPATIPIAARFEPPAADVKNEEPELVAATVGAPPDPKEPKSAERSRLKFWKK